MYTLLELLAGVLLTEWTFIFAARRLFGKYINDWYTTYGGWALLSDISSIMIGIMIALYIYRGKSLFALIGIAVLVQWIHDILFYSLVIRQVQPGTNGIIDILKPYGEDAGIAAVFGDSWMMVGSLGAAHLISKLPVQAQIFAVFVSGYMLPYAIYQKRYVSS